MLLNAALIAGTVLGLLYASIVNPSNDVPSRIFFKFFPLCVGLLCLVALLANNGVVFQL